MKKIILSLIVMLTIATYSNAQQVRLNAYGAYVFQDQFESYYSSYDYYQGTVEDGFQWGLGLEYMATETGGAELLYIRQDTHVPSTYVTGNNYTPKYTDFEGNINYIMVGGIRAQKNATGKVEGFGGLMMGVAWTNLTNPDNDNKYGTTKFAWGLKAGANIWASPKIAIKLNAQLLSAVQYVGGSLYYGTGGGGAGVSAYSSIYQFSLGGGIVYAFGE